jgi:hypothetical protein
MDTSPTVDEILATLAPSKSKPTYDRAWNSFLAFLKSGNEGDETEQDLEGNKENADQDDPGDAGVEAGQVGGGQPDEEGYIKYFHYLRNTKNFKSSSLWATYSRLNNCHQRKFGKRLQQWPRIRS